MHRISPLASAYQAIKDAQYYTVGTHNLYDAHNNMILRVKQYTRKAGKMQQCMYFNATIE